MIRRNVTLSAAAEAILKRHKNDPNFKVSRFLSRAVEIAEDAPTLARLDEKLDRLLALQTTAQRAPTVTEAGVGINPPPTYPKPPAPPPPPPVVAQPTPDRRREPVAGVIRTKLGADGWFRLEDVCGLLDVRQLSVIEELDGEDLHVEDGETRWVTQVALGVARDFAKRSGRSTADFDLTLKNMGIER